MSYIRGLLYVFVSIFFLCFLTFKCQSKWHQTISRNKIDWKVRYSTSMIMSSNNVLRYWPFVQGIHWSPVDSPHKGQWCGALMFSLIDTWTNGWANNQHDSDLRYHHAHYDVTVILRSSNFLCLSTVPYHIFGPEIAEKSQQNTLHFKCSKPSIAQYCLIWYTFMTITCPLNTLTIMALSCGLDLKYQSLSKDLNNMHGALPVHIYFSYGYILI